MRPSSSDPALIHAVLSNITTALARIERRFEGISDAEAFWASDEGIDRLDGITMMLIAMGEQLKQLDELLPVPLATQFPAVDWKGAKRIRDFLSHHYFSVDAEVIFDVCATKLDSLQEAIGTLLGDYS